MTYFRLPRTNEYAHSRLRRPIAAMAVWPPLRSRFDGTCVYHQSKALLVTIFKWKNEVASLMFHRIRSSISLSNRHFLPIRFAKEPNG